MIRSIRDDPKNSGKVVDGIGALQGLWIVALEDWEPKRGNGRSRGLEWFDWHFT